MIGATPADLDDISGVKLVYRWYSVALKSGAASASQCHQALKLYALSTITLEPASRAGAAAVGLPKGRFSSQGLREVCGHH